MRLRALLENDTLGLRLLGGEGELDRTVRGVMTTDLRDPSRYLSGGELVLTGLAWRREPEDSERFVRILAAAGVAGLAAGEAELGAVPEDLVLACGRHRLPLFSVVEDVAFATITEHVVRQVSGERAGDLAAVVDRHRRLMTSGPAGGGPEVALDLLRSDLDLTAWVLSPTGRRIAGPTAAGAAAEPPAAVRAQLAGEHLAARRDGRRGPHRMTAADGMTYSLFPIHSGDTDEEVRETVLSDWLLVVGADADEWPEERLDLLYGVTQLIAVERDRRNASRTVRRRLAQEVLELVQTGAPPAEIAARLRVAAPVLLPGLGTAPHWQVVVAKVEWGVSAAAEQGPEGGVRDGAARAGFRRDGGAVLGARVAQSLLEEILVDPAAPGPELSDRIAVAHTGDEAVALVPLPALTDGPPEGGMAHTADGLQADALLAAVQEPLSRGLDGDEQADPRPQRRRPLRRRAARRPGGSPARPARRRRTPRAGLRGRPSGTGLARTAAPLRPGRCAARLHRPAAGPAARVRPAPPGRADPDPGGVPGLRRLLDALRLPAASARQHAALPDRPDRTADRARTVAPGGQAGLLPRAAHELTPGAAWSRPGDTPGRVTTRHHSCQGFVN